MKIFSSYFYCSFCSFSSRVLKKNKISKGFLCYFFCKFLLLRNYKRIRNIILQFLQNRTQESNHVVMIVGWVFMCLHHRHCKKHNCLGCGKNLLSASTAYRPKIQGTFVFFVCLTLFLSLLVNFTLFLPLFPISPWCVVHDSGSPCPVVRTRFRLHVCNRTGIRLHLSGRILFRIRLSTRT